MSRSNGWPQPGDPARNYRREQVKETLGGTLCGALAVGFIVLFMALGSGSYTPGPVVKAVLGLAIGGMLIAWAAGIVGGALFSKRR